MVAYALERLLICTVANGLGRSGFGMTTTRLNRFLSWIWRLGPDLALIADWF